jgi:hypothetical protein
MAYAGQKGNKSKISARESPTRQCSGHATRVLETSLPLTRAVAKLWILTRGVAAFFQRTSRGVEADRQDFWSRGGFAIHGTRRDPKWYAVESSDHIPHHVCMNHISQCKCTVLPGLRTRLGGRKAMNRLLPPFGISFEELSIQKLKHNMTLCTSFDRKGRNRLCFIWSIVILSKFCRFLDLHQTKTAALRPSPCDFRPFRAVFTKSNAEGWISLIRPHVPRSH